MTIEEELIHLRDENKSLHRQLMQREERIEHLEMVLSQQKTLLQQMQEQTSCWMQEVKTWQDRHSKDSHNRSLPPSSDRFVRQPKSLHKKSEKKSGGQPGHEGASLQWSRTLDKVIDVQVEQCEACCHDLHAVAVSHVERRHVHDVPAPRVIVQEYRAEQKQCPVCQHLTAAHFPKDVSAPIQYGPTIGATAVYLVQQHLLPLARAGEVMGDLLGVRMSDGTMCSLIHTCATGLLEVEQQIKEALSTADVIHQDETGLSMMGKRYWEHVTCTATLTHYQVDPSRGQAALEAIGVLPPFKGIGIHDGWGSYFLYDCEHAACLVHSVRELVFLAEEQGAIWAHQLQKLLLDMKEATQQARSEGRHRLRPVEVADWEAQFLRLLHEGDQATPRATAPPGARGKCKQSPARNLLDRLRKHQKAVLCFLEVLAVDFENNLAERDLRMIKIQQKVSGCFRSLAGAQAFASQIMLTHPRLNPSRLLLVGKCLSSKSANPILCM